MARLLRILTPLLLASSFTFAQAPAKGAPVDVIPADAEAYLHEAAQSMLQRAPGDPSFHLKATFTATPDPNAGRWPAQETGTGTYEETWVSPTEWRKEVTFGAFHRTSGTEDGEKIWIVESTPDTPFVISQLLQMILPRIRPRIFDTKQKWSMTDVHLGNVALVRIGEADQQPSGGQRLRPENAYYFMPQNKVLVLSAVGMDTTHFTKFGKVGDKFALMAGTYASPFFLNLSFTTDSLTVNPKVDPASFTAPAEARIFIPDKSHRDTVVKVICTFCPRPAYPEIARANHVFGTVVIEGTIGTDGKVTSATPIAGPTLLRQAALDSVKTFRYEPTILDGSPVSIIFQVNVVFAFNSGR